MELNLLDWLSSCDWVGQVQDLVHGPPFLGLCPSLTSYNGNRINHDYVYRTVLIALVLIMCEHGIMTNGWAREIITNHYNHRSSYR